MAQIKRIVTIGCSGCGALSALMLKKLRPSLEVTIIREPQEKGLLTRCATPYICCGDVMVDPSYKDDSIFTEKRIRLVNVTAVKVDKNEKIVMTSDGNTYPYDKLVLATGARPIMPLIPGIDLPGFTARIALSITMRSSGGKKRLVRKPDFGYSRSIISFFFMRIFFSFFST